MNDEQVAEAAAFLRERGFEDGFDCAMVLGTGLGRLVDDLDDAHSLSYAEVPHFPAVGVSGHGGRLIAGRIERRRVLICQGRAHTYETGDPAAMRLPIAVARALGSPVMLLTNAAGSLKLDLRPSSLVAISDHINLTGLNPLTRDRGEGRFVSLTNAYDERLRKRLKQAAAGAGITLNEGVYMWFAGPTFETPAEIRIAKTLGADLVGMSTVPEVILARYYGMRVAAISVVTNMAAGIGMGAPSHEETRTVAAGATAGLRRLIRAFVTRIDDV